MGPLQGALIKYSYIGRTSNEKKMIAESQKELRAIKLITNIRNQTSTVRLEDILFFRGQFEMKRFDRPSRDPERSKPIAESVDWGLRTVEQNLGKVTVTYFDPFGPSMDSFFNKAKIAVFLFRRTSMFGVQKTVDKFKLKFSCRASEVVWDFNREHGLNSIMPYTPFGGLFLKCAPPKGTLPNFERNR
jgi:hypothetical protein